MGCASSKKQTRSVDDIPGAVAKDAAKPTQAPAQINKSKNGQVAANDSKSTAPPITKEVAKTTSAAPQPVAVDPTGAIRIPGAHTSFLAPDGIPFIDEDVDDETETGRPDGDSSIAVVKPEMVKPDVNKNIVKEPTSPPAQQPVAEVKPRIVVAASASERRPDDQPTPAQQHVQQQQLPQPSSEKDKSWDAAINTLTNDLEFQAKPDVELSSTHVTETHTSVTVTSVTKTTAEDHHVEPVLHGSDEQQQQQAAIKIQAGIRGYRDRQKVKAIRAAKQSHTDESAADAGVEKGDHPTTDDQLPHLEDVDVGAAVKMEAGRVEQSGHDAEQETEQDSGERQEVDDADDADPNKQRAAVKIQASYKGWKTRKSLSTSKDTQHRD